MTSTITDFLPQITSLQSEYVSLTSVLATETERIGFIQASRSLDYVVASLALYSAEQAQLTATGTQAVKSASAAVSSVSEVLLSISKVENVYGGMTPSYGGNMAMAIVMGIFFSAPTVLGVMFNTWWFGVSYFCGTGLEMAGYIGRTLSAHDTSAIDPFLLQIITLTLAPCFIMAAIYYLLGQLVMVYGTQFALLRPMWYSYIFIACDVISLTVQAAGGGLAATALKEFRSSDGGTHVMVAGLAFQVCSMSVFLFLFVHFFWKIHYLRKGHKELEPMFNPDYKDLRQNKLFSYFPVVILIAVLFVYTRSIYRVIKLAEGWTGFLITHEVYFMILDALMMALTCLLFIPFHPGFMLGKGEIPVQGMPSYKKMIKASQAEEFSENDGKEGGTAEGVYGEPEQYHA
ncbi:Sphingoid long-chain base transporter RSB1 [Cyberlindnera fabianii]|uniref:Sphingoid long-chain base transporter RSB1 n=1 Tax=Cyberlindnera fabianii TaxID=36022 RepID=A0A1V2L2U7_CYBFA|nr:Sphingoid long-chain base transporter RSB1 [Cyberlindnera fabianii]